MLDFTNRQTEIVALARSSGRVIVEELARRFEVSPQTIRKDLNELCERRVLTLAQAVHRSRQRLLQAVRLPIDVVLPNVVDQKADLVLVYEGLVDSAGWVLPGNCVVFK